MCEFVANIGIFLNRVGWKKIQYPMEFMQQFHVKVSQKEEPPIELTINFYVVFV